MDPTKPGDAVRHLEKQNELLLEAHNKMALELHKLKVEEEMLMRKCYGLMTSLGMKKKGKGTADAAKVGDNQVNVSATSESEGDNQVNVSTTSESEGQ